MIGKAGSAVSRPLGSRRLLERLLGLSGIDCRSGRVRGCSYKRLPMCTTGGYAGMAVYELCGDNVFRRVQLSVGLLVYIQHGPLGVVPPYILPGPPRLPASQAAADQLNSLEFCRICYRIGPFLCSRGPVELQLQCSKSLGSCRFQAIKQQTTG